MKFMLRREGAIALSYPLIYWYAAFSTIWGITSILKISLNPNTLRNTFKAPSNGAHTTHSFSSSTLLILAIVFFAIIYLAGLAINYYLIIGRSRRWVIGWFIIFTIGSLINLAVLNTHFDVYALLFNGISTLLTAIILWQLFFRQTRLVKPILVDSSKPEITINYQSVIQGKKLKLPEQPVVKKLKKHKTNAKTKRKAKLKKK